jgi:anti-sigma B factor antagonist
MAAGSYPLRTRGKLPAASPRTATSGSHQVRIVCSPRGYSPAVTVPVSRIGVDRIDGDVAVVDVLGEHDLTTAPKLSQRLDSLLGEGLGIVVDLSGATFIDSSVLAALLAASHGAGERGSGFAVAVPADGADGVRRVIEVTGLDQVVTMAGDREGAVDAVRGGRDG